MVGHERIICHRMGSGYAMCKSNGFPANSFLDGQELSVMLSQ